MTTDLDRYLDDFGAQLRAAEPPPPRRGLALGAALAVAAAAIAAVLLLAPGRTVDALAAAREALDPTGEIVHMRIRTEGELGATTEQWWTGDPVRWRISQQFERGKLADLEGPIEGRLEVAYAAGVHSRYVSGRDALLEVAGYAEDAPQSRMPTLLGVTGNEGLDLRAMLAGGEVQDLGEVRAGGRTVRRFVSERSAPGLPRTFTYDVDPVTFAPLEIALRFEPSAEGVAPPDTVMTVEAYERIPLTEESAKLLAIQPGAQTAVTRRTVAEQERIEQEALRCVQRTGSRDGC